MTFSSEQYRSFKLLSPAGCIIALLGFFLTFTEINCNGTTLDTITGVELATGYRPDIDLTESNDEPETKQEKYDPNVFALNAWIAAMLGLALFLIPKMRDQHALHLIIALIGFGCMIGLMFNLKSALNDAKSSGGVVNVDLPITFDMQPGYWIVTASFFLTLVADIVLWMHQRKVIADLHASRQPDNESNLS